MADKNKTKQGGAVKCASCDKGPGSGCAGCELYDEITKTTEIDRRRREIEVKEFEDAFKVASEHISEALMVLRNLNFDKVTDDNRVRARFVVQMHGLQQLFNGVFDNMGEVLG